MHEQHLKTMKRPVNLIAAMAVTLLNISCGFSTTNRTGTNHESAATTGVTAITDTGQAQSREQNQAPFFLNKVGMTAEYETKDSDGEVDGYSKLIVVRIDGEEIHYTYESFDEDKKPFGSPMVFTAKPSDGFAEDDYWLSYLMLGSMSGSAIFLNYPKNPEVGQTFDYDKKIEDDEDRNGAKHHIKSNMVIAGRDRVSVPAGAFECLRIEWDFTMLTTMGPLNLERIFKTTQWIAPGVGPVKWHTSFSHMSYDTVSITELVSLEP